MAQSISKNSAPNIFDYNDYRIYLSNYYDYMKSLKSFFSYRYFSRVAGLGGKNYLQVVIQGRRNLSPTSISKFIRALRFNKREASYFEALVLYNQAVSDEERDRYFAELVKFKPPIKIAGMTRDLLEYLTQNYYVTIREMAALPGFQADPEWIQARLYRPLKTAEIKKALEVLERLGLLTRNCDGQLVHSFTPLATPENIASMEMMQFHRQALSESKEALVQVPAHERDIASLTIPIPISLFGRISELLKRTREEIVALVNQSNGKYDEVYQINMQCFPTTQLRKKKQSPDGI